MTNSKSDFSPAQLKFQELFVGTLIYAVVLGFFSDYTSIVYAKSFSTIFLAAVLLEVLTFLTFGLKRHVVKSLKQSAKYSGVGFVGFAIWLIMFFSKFVFVWAIDAAFQDNMNVSGFIGILAVVACATIIHRVAGMIFAKLGNNS
jgi:hypothetical protein